MATLFDRDSPPGTRRCSRARWKRPDIPLRVWVALAWALLLAACAPGGPSGSRFGPRPRPLTVSRAVGLYDATRDASLQLVIAGLDEDERGRPSPALARYQRAAGVDPTNPFAYLALSRHHLEGGSVEEASAFLDQARSLFETEGRLGPEVDVWGVGLRAGIERARGREAQADVLFERARALAPAIWKDEALSAAELR
jgi:tetratricopeptide (TPR) repeat protein